MLYLELYMNSLRLATMRGKKSQNGVRVILTRGSARTDSQSNGEPLAPAKEAKQTSKVRAERWLLCSFSPGGTWAASEGVLPTKGARLR